MSDSLVSVRIAIYSSALQNYLSKFTKYEQKTINIISVGL